MIDTKANLKEQFSKLTMNRQPRPGPGSYSLAGSFAKVEKLREGMNFGSTNDRF